MNGSTADKGPASRLSPYRDEGPAGLGGEAKLRGELASEHLLHACAEAANEAQTAEDVIARVLESLCAFTVGRRAEIVIVDGRRSTVVHRCRRNDVLHEDKLKIDTADLHPAIRKSMEDRERRWLDPVRKTADDGHHSGAVSPIVAAGEVVGAVVVYFEAPTAATESFLVVIDTISRQIGEVLRRTRAEAALQASSLALAEAAAAHRLLAEAGEILVSTLDYSDTLSSVARLTVKSLADWCIVYVAQPDGTLRRAEVAHADPADKALADELRAKPLPSELSYPIHEVLASGRTEWASNLKLDPASRDVEDVFSHLGAASFVAVPLKARGSILGVLAIISASTDRANGPAWIGLAEKLATICALAIDNARLYAEARQATLRRDEILHMVSHDLRTPLAAIEMGIDRLKRRAPVPDRRSGTIEVLERIGRLVSRMNRLIGDLLDLGYLERGQLALQRSSESAANLAREVVDQFQELARAHRIHLDFECAQDIMADADRDRGAQVLANLIDNAIRYSHGPGTVRVTVSSEGGAAHFTVTDEGPGIPAAQLGTIFDPYVQAKQTGRAGAGLGLAIAKRITEAHGGRIWVESEVDCGSRFHVLLPAAGRQAQSESAAE